MESSPCLSTTDRKKAVEELIHGREFVNELQLLFQNQNPLTDNEVVVANNLVTRIITSFTKVLLVLKTSDLSQSSHLTVTSSPVSDDRKSVESKRNTTPAVKDRRGGYKRRKTSDSWTEITAKPKEDGHAWRKYGQKEILNAKYPRNYFRCTHKNDQGCQATKQVQRTDDEPRMYTITYLGQHTCTNPLKPLQLILNTTPTPSPSSTPTTCNNNIFNLTSFSKQEDYNPFTTPAIKLVPSLSHQYHYSPDLTGFESLLASSSGSTDHGDVISGSGMYSCTTSPESLDADLIDFSGDTFLDEDTFLNELLYCDH